MIHPGVAGSAARAGCAARNSSCSLVPERPMGRPARRTCRLPRGNSDAGDRPTSAGSGRPRVHRGGATIPGRSRRAFVRPERQGFPRCARRFVALTPGSLRLESHQEGRWPSSLNRPTAQRKSEMRHMVTPSGARCCSAVDRDVQVPSADPRPPPRPSGSVSRRRSWLDHADVWISIQPPSGSALARR